MRRIRAAVSGAPEEAARRLPLWRRMTFLLWVLLLLPGFAQASSSPPPPLVPAPSTPEEPPSESEQGDPYGGYDDEPQEDEPRGEIFRGGLSLSGIRGRQGPRVVVASLSGLTLGLLGLAPGAYLGFTLAASESSTHSDDAVLGAIALSAVGVTAGTALGVFGGGTLLWGEGRFLPTLAGAALGAVAGAFLAIPAGLIVEGGWVIPVLTLPLVGALIAYERSHEEEHTRKAAEAGTPVGVVPVISLRSSGGLVAGLAGRF